MLHGRVVDFRSGARLTWRILITAMTTGAFCAVFAVLIQFVTTMLALWQVIGLAAVSGFLGSLFASLVWGRRDK